MDVVAEDRVLLSPPSGWGRLEGGLRDSLVGVGAYNLIQFDSEWCISAAVGAKRPAPNRAIFAQGRSRFMCSTPVEDDRDKTTT